MSERNTVPLAICVLLYPCLFLSWSVSFLTSYSLLDITPPILPVACNWIYRRFVSDKADTSKVVSTFSAALLLIALVHLGYIFSIVYGDLRPVAAISIAFLTSLSSTHCIASQEMNGHYKQMNIPLSTFFLLSLSAVVALPWFERPPFWILILISFSSLAVLCYSSRCFDSSPTIATGTMIADSYLLVIYGSKALELLVEMSIDNFKP